jgi:hypothetical protein
MLDCYFQVDKENDSETNKKIKIKIMICMFITDLNKLTFFFYCRISQKLIYNLDILKN